MILVMASFTLCNVAFGAYVDLEVDGTYPDAQLKITASDVKCGNDLGCIRTTKGKALDVDFRLKQACKTDGPEYKLTGMQFSMIQTEPDAAGGTTKPFGKYALPPVVTGDFDLDAQGNVIWDGVNNNKLTDDKIKLRNKNDGQYVIFYKIQATHCTNPGDIIYLDPRIENTGK